MSDFTLSQPSTTTTVTSNRPTAQEITQAHTNRLLSSKVAEKTAPLQKKVKQLQLLLKKARAELAALKKGDDTDTTATTTTTTTTTSADNDDDDDGDNNEDTVEAKTSNGDAETDTDPVSPSTPSARKSSSNTGGDDDDDDDEEEDWAALAENGGKLPTPVVEPEAEVCGDCLTTL